MDNDIYIPQDVVLADIRVLEVHKVITLYTVHFRTYLFTQIKLVSLGNKMKAFDIDINTALT